MTKLTRATKNYMGIKSAPNRADFIRVFKVVDDAWDEILATKKEIRQLWDDYHEAMGLDDDADIEQMVKDGELEIPVTLKEMNTYYELMKQFTLSNMTMYLRSLPKS